MILIYLRGLWTVRGIRNYYTIVQVYCIAHTVHIQYMFMFKRKYWSEPKRHTEKGTHDTEKDAEKLKKTQSSQRAAAAVCKRFIKKTTKKHPLRSQPALLFCWASLRWQRSCLGGMSEGQTAGAQPSGAAGRLTQRAASRDPAAHHQPQPQDWLACSPGQNATIDAALSCPTRALGPLHSAGSCCCPTPLTASSSPRSLSPLRVHRRACELCTCSPRGSCRCAGGGRACASSSGCRGSASSCRAAQSSSGARTSRPRTAALTTTVRRSSPPKASLLLLPLPPACALAACGCTAQRPGARCFCSPPTSHPLPQVGVQLEWHPLWAGLREEGFQGRREHDH